MFTLVQKRRYFFAISTVVIVIGLVLMGYSILTTGSPFNLSNDFVGGSIYELDFGGPGADEANIRQVFEDFGNTDIVIQSVGDPAEERWSIRADFQDFETQSQIQAALAVLAPLDQERTRIEQVSPAVGAEVGRAAVGAVAVSAIVVTGFMVLAFRHVPHATRYGVSAIVAMLHDVLVLCAVMALASLLLGWQADTLFLTALLTVVGFSVQDTIVVFDRIRENIIRYLGEPYEAIVNRSLIETLHRSLATQLNAFFIMAAILLFGGPSVRQFIAILFIGMLTGTYSSIFIASPVLVAWEKGEIPFVNRKKRKAAAQAEAA
ncbi:MAG: protein translocase subunit SecF [Anaerolineae bacterium]|nr:protein translocase subunit SecF [Anaerolineae bacterium]